MFLFFQAEDGIRAGHVTGVQTCALPISATFPARRPLRRLDSIWLLGALRGGELDVARTRASDHRPVVATIHRLGREDAAPTGWPIRTGRYAVTRSATAPECAACGGTSDR